MLLRDPSEVRLALGGMVLAFLPGASGIPLRVGERHQPFLTNAVPDVTLRVHRGETPLRDLGRPLFDSGGNWALHQVEGRSVIHVRVPGSDVSQVVILAPDFLDGDIHCIGPAWNEARYQLTPLGYPLEEVLIVHLLARGRGVLLHASAVRDGQRGLLFSGVSGAGKSTMASLWQGRPGVTVLSDDRVIVREREGRFWAYGTPWHGSARIASPEAVPVDGIFVLQHAGENQAAALAPLDAASRLLVRSFPTFWDAEGMAFTLGFLSDLCRSVPCHDLGFVPDGQVVDFVRRKSAA